MQILRDFSEKALKHIKLWTWAAAILPITSLAGLFFIRAFGTENCFDTALTVGATFMFGVAAVWWWWIIWVVTRILKKDRRVANDLLMTTKEIRNIKVLVKETFGRNDK